MKAKSQGAKPMVLLLCVLCTLLPLSCTQKKELTNEKKLALLARSWGVLKYFDHSIGTTEIDWDSVLVAKVAEIQQTNSVKEFNQSLTQLFSNSRPVPGTYEQGVCSSDSAESMASFDWVRSAFLSEENQDFLLDCIRNKKHYKNRFVSDSVRGRSLGYARFYESPLPDADLTDPGIRLLGLFRYWNIVEYFYPYKDIIDKDWDDVLMEYIPRFLSAEDRTGYYQELLLLSTEINDGHASIPYHPEERRNFFGKFRPPFNVRMVEGLSIIDKVLSDSLGALLNVKVGDIITEIDGRPVEEKVRQIGKYLPNPNQGFHNDQISLYLLNGNTEKLHLKIDRNGEQLESEVTRFTFADMRKYRDLPSEEPFWKDVGNHIGYVHMGVFNTEHLKEFDRKLEEVSALIMDFRYYPNWQVFHEVLSRLTTEKKPFVLAKSQCLNQPGTFSWYLSESDLPYITLVDEPFSKPVVLLVDSNTLSFGEYFVMGLQTQRHVKVLGSQTAGEDGNQVGIEMPGGMRMFFSSLGIYYPNGELTQRSGISIDVPVNLTVEDIKNNQYPFLMTALDHLMAESQ